MCHLRCAVLSLPQAVPIVVVAALAAAAAAAFLYRRMRRRGQAQATEAAVWQEKWRASQQRPLDSARSVQNV